MNVFIFIFYSYFARILARNWESNGEYEFYFYGPEEGITRNYEGAASKCTEEDATLAMIKSEEIENFIAAQSWQYKFLFEFKFWIKSHLHSNRSTSKAETNFNLYVVF